MSFEVRKKFKLKCENCAFREVHDIEAEALSAIGEHCSYRYEGAPWHEVKMTEYSLVSRKEDL